jgi:hypothetical protein
MVGIAEGMQAVQLKIGFPVIMTENAGKLGQDILCSHGFVAPLGMGVIQCPLWI